MDIASRLHEIEKKKFALLQTLAGLPLRITNRFVSMEKGVHCTLNIYCNPVGIVGEGGRNTRSASIQRRRRRSREERRYSRGRNTRFVKRGDI